MGRSDEGRPRSEVRGAMKRLQGLDDAITATDYEEIRRADVERIRHELDTYESENDRQKREWAEANRKAREDLAKG